MFAFNRPEPPDYSMWWLVVVLVLVMFWFIELRHKPTVIESDRPIWVGPDRPVEEVE